MGSLMTIRSLVKIELYFPLRLLIKWYSEARSFNDITESLTDIKRKPLTSAWRRELAKVMRISQPLSSQIGTLKLSELFYSLQGEGIDAGKPAVFIRTALCNLSCVWCDTKYTWDWTHYDYDREVSEMTLSEIQEQISKFDTKHCVITGGEPLMQQIKLIPLLSDLKNKDYFIEVETNGTILPSETLEEVVDRWNVSPKLQNSSISKQYREVQSCMEYFAKNSKAFMKFVICNQSDISEVKTLIGKYELKNQRIILMPEGNSAAEIMEKFKWLSEICLLNGFRLSIRLHTLVWSGTRAK
jgi:7-carboxy-7-deazaguanine synthase